MNVFDLTPHQLDVLRTMFAGIGAVGTFIIGANTVLTVLTKKWAKQAANQTLMTEWQNGELVQVPYKAAHGRRRLPTDSIPIRERSR